LIGRIGLLRVSVLMIVALSVLPVGYVLRAEMHKKALCAAIDAVYHPDYAESGGSLNLSQSRIALTRLHKMKNGIYAPLLSEIYDSIVFDGMVLPDHKLGHMEKILFGEKIDVEKNGSPFELFGFIGASRNRRQNWSNVRPPAKTVEIEDVAISAVTNGALIEAEIVLRMQNEGKRQAEFVTSINIPESVAVSGYWLDVESERVQGKVFDRKTALWVFHMIRDSTRRDPGMIHYIEDETLELRVFPFSSNQTRQCAVTLLYPRGLSPEVSIGKRKLAMPSSANVQEIVLAGTDDATGVSIPAGRDLPSIRRKSYLHVLVDVSAAAVESMSLASEKIAKVLVDHPEIDSLKIDLVNHETSSVGTEYMNRDNWRDNLELALSSVNPVGGFWPERAVNHLLLKQSTAKDVLEMVPLVMLVSEQALEIDDSELIPEVAPDVVITTPVTMGTNAVECMVYALRCNDQIKFMEAGGSGVVSFMSKGAVEVYDAEDGWVGMQSDIQLHDDSRYSKHIAMQAFVDQMESYPHLADDFRDEVLALSKDSGLLTRHTAYIVVENSAQWEMLKRKEKDAMKSDSALEFDEFQETHVTPEPETWILFCIGIAVLLMHRFRVGRKRVKA